VSYIGLGQSYCRRFGIVNVLALLMCSLSSYRRRAMAQTESGRMCISCGAPFRYRYGWAGAQLHGNSEESRAPNFEICS